MIQQQLPVGTVGNQLLRVWKREQVRDSNNYRCKNGFEVFHSFHRRLRNMLRHDPPNKTRQFSCRSVFRYISGGMGRDSVELLPRRPVQLEHEPR